MNIISPFTNHNLKDVGVKSHIWSGFEVQALHLDVLPGKAWHQLSAELPILSIVVNEAGGRCEARMSLDKPPSAKARDRRSPCGHTSIIPGKSSIWGYSEDIEFVDEVRLILDPALITKIVDYNFSFDLLEEPELMFFDEPLQRLGSMIAYEHAYMEDFPLLGDSIVASIVARLTDLQVSHRPATRRLGLSAGQIASVNDYIAANLERQIRLAELSALTGLSPSQFGRAFKVSTGMAPHKWHINQRISRSKQLLVDRNKSIAEIALDTGFSEQSHFTRTFHKEVGLSPAAWRRAQMN